MDLRGSSTTLDTVVFVLLVGAAVGTLAGISPGGGDGPTRVPGETADVLATSTAEVTFERRGHVPGELIAGSSDGRSVSAERRARGTYAELLAAAAVADPELGSRPLTASGEDFETAVVEATERALPTDATNVQVRAVWEPYDGAALGRTVLVGEAPPRTADVSVATVTVASGFPNVTSEVRDPAPGYDATADTVARAVVAGLFPANRTRDALASEGPDRAVVVSRYLQAAAVLDVAVADPLARGDVDAANDRLAAALARRVEADMVEQFDSPTAAGRAVSLHRVRIVVRTWSP